MNLVGKKDLTPVKLQAATNTDQNAKSVLGKLHVGASYALVYILKIGEAREVLAKYPTNPGVIDTSAWPLLAAEVGLTGATIWDVASAYLAEVAQLKAQMAPIEKARVAAQVAISGATTSDQVHSAAQVTWPA